MKNIFFLIVLFLSIIPTTVLAFGIGLTPSTIEMEVKLGSHHRQILKVKNLNSKKAIRLTASVADWTLDEEGKVHLLPPSESQRSASDWVNFSPSVLLLQPNTTQEIIVDLNTPLITKSVGDHRTAIVLSTVLPSKKMREGKNGVWNRYQIASLFYVNMEGKKSKPNITHVELTPAKNNQLPMLALAIDNKGDTHSRPKGEIVLRKKSSGEMISQSFETVLISNQKRNYNIKLGHQDLKPGKYDVIIKLLNEGRRISNLTKHKPVLTIQ